MIKSGPVTVMNCFHSNHCINCIQARAAKFAVYVQIMFGYKTVRIFANLQNKDMTALFRELFIKEVSGLCVRV